MNYPSHWRLAYLLAFFLHLGLWLFASLALPHLHFMQPSPPEVHALEWAPDVPPGEGAFDGLPPGDALSGPLPPDPSAIAEEAIAAPTDEADDEAGDIPDEEAPLAEETPLVAQSEAEAIAQLKKAETEGNDSGKPQTVIIRTGSGSGQQMGENAQLVKPYYPAPGIVSFRGRVSVSGRIGKDGRIHETKIMITSGRPLVDALAMNCAKKWIYKPATDRNGQPMECNAIISIPFDR